MATLTGSATEPAGTLTAPTVGADTDTWGTILNETTLQALLNYALWLKLRVPAVAPTLEADGRILTVQSGALAFADAATGGATAFTGLTDTPSAYTGEGQKLVRVNAGETGLEFVTAAGGGDVTGPAGAVDDRIATFDGVTGKIIKDSGTTIAGLATSAQGALADTAVQPGDPVSVNVQTGTTYTLVLADAGKLVTLENANAIALTVPLNSSVAFPVGTVIAGAQLGAGLVSIAGAAGVTINGTDPGAEASSGQWSTWSLTKLATDTWLASGGLA